MKNLNESDGRWHVAIVSGRWVTDDGLTVEPSVNILTNAARRVSRLPDAVIVTATTTHVVAVLHVPTGFTLGDDAGLDWAAETVGRAMGPRPGTEAEFEVLTDPLAWDATTTVAEQVARALLDRHQCTRTCACTAPVESTITARTTMTGPRFAEALR